MQKAIIITNEEVESIKLELATIIEYAERVEDGKEESEESEDICRWISERLKRLKNQFE